MVWWFSRLRGKLAPRTETEIWQLQEWKRLLEWLENGTAEVNVN